MITRVKGTQDFLDLKLYNFFAQTVQKHLAQYNYKEISVPILEPVELFTRSIGEHTDIVNKEMFTFTTKGEEVIALRPEATASIARAFSNAEGEITTPWKVFTSGPMFRYERPQKGRYRQFHQVSIELIGSNAVAQDAQFIKMLDDLFRKKLSLDSFVLVINYLGCLQDRKNFAAKVVDFLDKNFDLICDTCKERKSKNTLRIFDCKNPECIKLYENAPILTDNLCDSCTNEWKELKEDLDILSVSYIHQPRLVRGLDYYNKTVFEFVSTSLGAQNTFCGGGRYDQLISMIGGKEDQPSIGAAMGIERIIALMEIVKDKLHLPEEKALSVVMSLAQEQNLLALLVANHLINANFTVETMFAEGSIKSMMRKANKLGAKNVILLGENEQKTQTATVKNMQTGEEKSVPQTKIVEIL